MASYAPDPKPAPRVKATTAEWEELRRAKLGPCRICGRGPATLHHLVPRSLGGGDVEDNLVPLCGDGTRGCHGAIENRNDTECRELRANLTMEEFEYILRVKGAGFLQRYLPR